MNADVDEAEIWRQVESDPAYEVSSLGSVRRMPGYRCRFGRIIATPPNADGYPHCRLWTGGVGRTATVHLLVLRAFIGPKPSPIHECAHWDGDEANARLDNLRWATPKENAADKIRHGTNIRSSESGAKLSAPQVLSLLERVAAGEDQAAVAASLDITKAQVLLIVRGHSWRRLESPFRAAAAARIARVGSGNAKLSATAIGSIVQRMAAGARALDLAAEHDVNIATIYRAATERSYAGVAAGGVRLEPMKRGRKRYATEGRTIRVVKEEGRVGSGVASRQG